MRSRWAALTGHCQSSDRPSKPPRQGQVSEYSRHRTNDSVRALPLQRESPSGSPTDACAPPRDHLQVCRFGLTGRFRATNSRARMSVQGRPLPAVGVSYPVAQVAGQLSGGQIARPTGASRPRPAGRVAPKRPDSEPPSYWPRAASTPAWGLSRAEASWATRRSDRRPRRAQADIDGDCREGGRQAALSR